MTKGECINHYVSVVVGGKLDAWTGRNPDRFPEDREKALERARHYRSRGYSAYAVDVKEIFDPTRVSGPVPVGE